MDGRYYYSLGANKYKTDQGALYMLNKRLDPGHIAARLDRFLVQSSYLTLGFNALAEILPHSASDHKPIRLEFKSEQGKGPIPFRFNPSWIQDQVFLKIVSNTWTSKVIGSASYVWEEKRSFEG